MKIETRALNFAITAEQVDYVEQRLGLALGSCSKYLRRVEVWLSDFQLPHGDSDRRCLVEVKLEGQAIVFSEGVDPDFNLAIHHAVDAAVLRLYRGSGSSQSELLLDAA